MSLENHEARIAKLETTIAGLQTLAPIISASINQLQIGLGEAIKNQSFINTLFTKLALVNFTKQVELFKLIDSLVPGVPADDSPSTADLIARMETASDQLEPEVSNLEKSDEIISALFLKLSQFKPLGDSPPGSSPTNEPPGNPPPDAPPGT